MHARIRIDAGTLSGIPGCKHFILTEAALLHCVIPTHRIPNTENALRPIVREVANLYQSENRSVVAAGR